MATKYKQKQDVQVSNLPLNPLDLSSQKSKASVGRSATRRPPTRQRPKEDSPAPSDSRNSLRNAHLTATTNLHRVSRLCHQIHETAVRQAFGKRSPRPSIKERQSGDGSVEIYEIESVSSNETRSDARTNGHTNLSRTKSTSSDDIHVIPEKDSSTKSIEDLEDLEQLQNWRRTSKLRRSLQFPNQNKTTTNSKPVDLPENSVSVRKIREDLEKGRRLNTALRNNSVDLEALDQILQSISSSSSIHSDKTSDNADDAESESTNRKQKRNSFVTVESIQEVKGRLRRTSSPTSDIYKANGKEDDHDDGIVTEEISSKDMPVIEKPAAQSRVRSYVYGMEALLNKKPGLGTGSLESRVKLVNGNSPNRNEDWYNRRKSYGFEQMHNQEDSTNSMSFKNKNLVESSTDSGICRSTEIVLVPTATKTGTEIDEDDNISDNNSDLDQKYNGFEGKHTTGKVKQMANTFTQDDNSSVHNNSTHEKPWDTFSSYKASDWSNPETELKSTTITIPIMKNNNIVDLSWNDEPEKDIKRHSIAVDESKYVTKNTNENKFRRTSLALNDQYVKNDEDDINPNRRPKKVEFCKTEVHFAAESGRVNIVATDEKPPPRRTSDGGVEFHPYLPRILTKTAYQCCILQKPDNLTSIYENIPSTAPSTFGVVTVNTTNNTNNEYVEEDKKDLAENENIKGILKNKPIKPKPYHLGETVPFSEPNSDEDTKNWGVRLRHVEKEDIPIWKSTVTVHNYYEKQPRNDEDNQPEFQKLLKNLRPTRKSDYTSDNENRYSDSFSGIRVVSSSVKDNRRSSWSVADKIKTTEDGQSVENRGYSTKVNFGEGEATVVENDGFYDKDRHPTWPRMENSSKDSKQILNKGLVVRIGREDSASNHTVCSKMTTMQDTNNRTTTTKITIDLSPLSAGEVGGVLHNHSFKSTSLILSTIKDKGETKKTADIRTAERRDDRIPQQLEALKKLYEDVQSDSDADKEVQLLMSKITENDKVEDDDSSVVSGSWSKMRAYKKVTEHFGRTNVRHDLKLNTKSEKDTTERLNETSADRNNTAKYTNPNRSNFSPIALRKAIPVLNRPDLKSAVTTEKLSSPSLVGRNCNSYDYTEKLEPPNGRLSPSKGI
ncbi:hypothetical protein NQ318_011573 [Aromia moschata]|uniref:Uncharacterized protein n=1 Tax=Aromia moschata TaxID=1265417 RepID=A0AAV8Z8T1_9CUCU|nr:hypothetical protein NQ318_011573 [Aromia moschata]